MEPSAVDTRFLIELATVVFFAGGIWWQVRHLSKEVENLSKRLDHWTTKVVDALKEIAILKDRSERE